MTESVLEQFQMVEVPEVGRRYSLADRIRLNDVGRDGSLRLDSLVRYSQVISNDDTNDAGLDEDLAWIARSTVVDVIQPGFVDEPLEFTTFCGGLGRTWAQRRVSVTGQLGARYEIATLWVSIEPEALRPRKLSEQFLVLYGPSAEGRKVSARQLVSRPDEALIAHGTRLEWSLRWGDFDRFGHLNNLVYWSIVQHAHGGPIASGTRILVEHGAGVQPAEPIEIVVDPGNGGLRLWWLGTDGAGDLSNQYRAAAQLISLG